MSEDTKIVRAGAKPLGRHPDAFRIYNSYTEDASPQEIVWRGAPARIEWTPQADITVYELAQAMPALLCAVSGTFGYPEDLISKLPAAVARHFKVTPST